MNFDLDKPYWNEFDWYGVWTVGTWPKRIHDIQMDFPFYFEMHLEDKLFIKKKLQQLLTIK